MHYSNYFYDLFFKSSPAHLNSNIFKSEIADVLKSYSYSYQQDNPAPIIKEYILNKWYEGHGQAILSNLFLKLWEILSGLSENAMPSHDARHAIFKTPASALELIQSEKVQGWERVGVLGALMHDWGRWAEERVFNAPQGGAIHSRMSFVLAKEYLEEFDIPLEIKWHILNAVLRHTKGAVETDPMVTKITVTADREQLWGPEFVIRMLHHVKSPGACEVFYKEKGKDDIFSKIERIFVNRLLGPLHSRNNHLATLKGVLAQFLYLSGTDEFKANIEVFMENSQNWLPLNSSELLKSADLFETSIQSSGEALTILLNSKNIAPGKDYRDSAVQRIIEIPTHLNSRMAKAIMLTNQFKIKEEIRVKQSLTDLLQVFNEDEFLYKITLTLHKDI